ncbi:hypothetical protein K7432_004382 [Basidiobolus ranarum]|uniref:Uncharacterized protein n=1 Tax=Basidiobolus ranarum TaxID=34480 RepID=A0ABR2WY84_9FUNG
MMKFALTFHFKHICITPQAHIFRKVYKNSPSILTIPNHFNLEKINAPFDFTLWRPWYSNKLDMSVIHAPSTRPSELDDVLYGARVNHDFKVDIDSHQPDEIEVTQVEKKESIWWRKAHWILTLLLAISIVTAILTLTIK